MEPSVDISLPYENKNYIRSQNTHILAKMTTYNVSTLFYNCGYKLEYETDAEFDKNRLDKDVQHTSHAKIIKSRLNELGRDKLHLFDARNVALKIYCTGNPSARLNPSIPQNLVNIVTNYRDNLTLNNAELDYEKIVYERVSQIPELENNIIKYISYDKIPLDIQQYNGKLQYQNNPLYLPLQTNATFPALNELFFPASSTPTDIKDVNALNYISQNLFYLNIIATEFTNGILLRSLMRNSPHPFDDNFILPIFFQIVWGIQILQKHGIQHNDMHENNIFIVLDTPTTMNRHHMTTNGDIFVMPPNSPRVLFFDWDLANMTTYRGPKASNPILCTNHGICGVLNERRDLYRAFFEFFSAQRDFMSPNALTFLDFFLSGPQGSQKLKFVSVRTNDKKIIQDRTYPCNVKPGDPFTCQPYNTDEPNEIHNSTTLLAHPVFQRYKLDTSLPSRLLTRLGSIANYFSFKYK